MLLAPCSAKLSAQSPPCSTILLRQPSGVHRSDMVLSSWESGAVLDQGAPAGRVIHSPPEPRQLEFSLATQDVANKTDCAVNRHQGKRRDQGGGRRGRGR